MQVKAKALPLVILPILFTNIATAEMSFKPGAAVRLRHEFWKNIFDQENETKDNRNFFRVKSSIWGDMAFNENARLYARLTNEFKAYTYYYQSSNQKKGVSFDIDEVVIDNLFTEFKNLFDLPVNLRLGRQDFLGTYGEGFLIMDGTPLDGSRTYYFNAAQVGWQITDENLLDFVYINDPRDEEFFPVINKKDPIQALNKTDEQGYMLYLKNKSYKNLNLEPYYIYKIEDDEGGARLQSQNSHIHTFGAFNKYLFDPFTLRAQGAFQEGDYGDHQREGYGWYMFLDYSMKEKQYKPVITVGVIDLSGDDPATNTNEGWDPLFSRFPWYSEMYSLSFNGESGLDYWTNLVMYRTQFSLQPTEKIKVALNYNYLKAHEIPVGTSFATGDGKNRGQLPQFRVDYAMSKNITTYFTAEYFIPGNFYADTADESLFLRTECMVKF
jgi:hypothetical protein